MIGCRMLLITGVLVVFAANVLAIEIEYNPRPRRLGQTEYVRIANVPELWMGDSLKSFLLYSTSEPGSACQRYPARIEPGCLSAFDGVVEFESEFGDIRRLSYRALPEFTGKMYVSVALANLSRHEFSFSEIGEIDFDARPPETFVPRPTIYDATEPYLPQRNTSTVGDICVDALRGNDQNTGICPNEPVRSISVGLNRFRGLYPSAAERAGKTILIREGVYQEGMNLINWEGLPGAPIQVRGYPGERILLSLWTESPEEFRRRTGSLPANRDQWYNEILGGFYGVNLSGAKNLVLENISVEGARVEGVNPDNTENVRIRFVNVSSSGRWGIQAFGTLRNLTIEGCTVMTSSNTWSSEHGIYIAPLGEAGAPLSSGIELRANTLLANERFGLQVNGAAQDVLIENNISLGNKLGGISVYGITGAVIRNNVVAMNNQQPLVLFNYFDTSYLHNGYGPDPLGYGRQDANHFGRTRNRTSAYITVAHNTFISGPRALFSSGLDPSEMESIRLAEQIGSDINGDPLGEPFFGIEIFNNILANVNGTAITQFVTNQELFSRGYRMLEGVRVSNNLIYNTAANPRVKLAWQPLNEVHSRIDEMQSLYPNLWSSNILHQDPQFVHVPTIRQSSGMEDLREYAAELLSSNYSLQASSPAVNAAIQTRYASGLERALSVDVRGVYRAHGGAPDLGAYEREE